MLAIVLDERLVVLVAGLVAGLVGRVLEDGHTYVFLMAC